MRNVVFVTPFPSNSMEYVRAAAGLNDVRVLGITQKAPSGDDAKVFADVVTVDSTDDAAQLVAAARVLESRHGRIHRVLGIRESLQVPIGELRRVLHVPGPGPDTAVLFRDKARMKDELRRHGLPCARHRLIRSSNDAESLLADLGLPMVLKPLAGSGCKTTFRVRTIDELRNALPALQASPEKPALAEQMLVGREHSFDAITIGGKVRFYSLSQFSPTTLEAVEVPGRPWVVVLPRDISGPEWSDAIDLGFRTIAALGLDTGVSHMEWFRCDDGSLAVSEIAARPAAGNHMPLTAWAHNMNDVDMDLAWARAVVDDAFDGPYERRYAVGCAYLRGVGRGHVQRITGVDRVRELFGPLLIEARVAALGAPSCEDYDGDVSISLRHPETEVVVAAMKTITETITIEYR